MPLILRKKGKKSKDVETSEVEIISEIENCTLENITSPEEEQQ